ncbi:MAG: preprotein translocase subunit SecY [Candidatus Sericytochromatia bacterium]|nr:preprotein translocase subunit SecY [Candidatus Sericytochromatia bacterium]
MQEQNKVIGVLRDLWHAPGLREKVFWTLGMVLVFRFVVHIPISGINHQVLDALFNQMNFLGGFLDFFSGGALAKFSIVAMGITPYINASIIMQLMTGVIPKLEELQKEGGEAGRKQIQQWTRYLMLVLATIQSFGMTNWLWKSGAALGHDPAGPYPWWFMISTVSILVAGSAFIMWLGEVITERGIGNGASLMIFAGIIAAFPSYFAKTGELMQSGGISGMAVGALLLALLAMLVAIVFVQEGQRRIPVQSAKRQSAGGRFVPAQQSYIPLRVNMGGVMPLIFASSLLIFPATVSQLLGAAKTGAVNWQVGQAVFWQWENVKAVLQYGLNHFMAALSPSGYLYFFVYFALIMFFAYFYASLVLNPNDLAENLKKYGSFVPGYKPGKPTADFIEWVLNRVTFAGGVFLGLIAVLPYLVERATGVTTLQGLGSTALLIMVGVAIDLYNQLQTHLIARQYEGFMS